MNNSAFLAVIGTFTHDSSLGRFIEVLRALPGVGSIMDAPNVVAVGALDAAHIILSDGQGVIWGHVFDRSSGTRIRRGDEPRMAEGPAEQFLTSFWGGYLAVRVHAGGVELLRDPSGGVACYHCAVDSCHIVTTRPELLFEHGLLTPEIDWTILAQSLAFTDLRPAATALRGISELLPGAAAQVEGGAFRTRCGWSPWRFTLPEAEIIDRDEAIASLREALQMSLSAWGGCFLRPLLEISGGLDSSIVAAGLGAGGARCLTFGPPPGDPDERPYARAVANHLGLELIELMPAIDAIDITISDARHLPRPCARAFSQALDRPIAALAVELGIDAFLGGGGGDSVFCHLQSALPVLDRLEREGPGLGMLSTALDIASQSRTHLWAVARTAAQRWSRRRSRFPRGKPNRFLRGETIRALPWPTGNPWLEAPAALGLGKKRHIWSVIAIQNHLEGYGREALAPHVSPLMSQPILETCLAIPSWLWVEGGNSRVIAREAVRDLLPALIIDRRTKGGFDTFAVQLIEANKVTIESMLLDGALARQGLLDLRAVDDFLRGRLADNEGVAELLALVDAEAWVNGWEAKGRGAALANAPARRRESDR